MARFFHATRLEYVSEIKQEGLKPIWDYIYLTDSLQSAINWMGFRFQIMGDSGVAVIEVEADPRTLGEGQDHHPIMQHIFGAGNSYISEKRIPKSRIKKIHYFKFDGNSTSRVPTLAI